MDTHTFLLAMNRGRYSEAEGLAGSSYCVFTAPVELQVTQDRLYLEGDNLVLELLYGLHSEPGVLRLRQVDTNVVLEESPAGGFVRFLADKQVKYIGQLLMYALQFKIQDLSAYVAGCAGAIKELEDALDTMIFRWDTCLKANKTQRAACQGGIQKLTDKGIQYLQKIRRKSI